MPLPKINTTYELELPSTGKNKVSSFLGKRRENFDYGIGI